MTIHFTVVGRLAGAGSKTFMPRGGKAGGRPIAVPASKYTRGWMDSVRAEAAIAARNLPGLMRGAIALVVTFYVPRPNCHFRGGIPEKGLKESAPMWPHHRSQPDRTKLLRATEDAMTGVVWVDDRQVVTGNTDVKYGEPMRAEIIVEELA